MRRVYLTFKVTALAVTLSACGGVPIYSESRDKQGLALKEAWQGVDLQSRFAISKGNTKAVLDKELSTAQSISLERAQQTLRAGVASPSLREGFLVPAEKEVVRLIGSQTTAAEWGQARQRETLAAKGLETASQEFQFLGFEMPSCYELNGPKSAEVLAPLLKASQGDSAQADRLRGVLSFVRQQCASPDVTATRDIKLNGTMSASRKSAQVAAQQLEDVASQTRSLRNEYSAAMQAHQDALSKLNEGDDTRERLASAADRLKAVIPKLEKAQDVFSKEFIAKQKIDSINSFTALLTSTDKDSETIKGDSKAAATLVFFTDWADETSKSLAQAQTPALAPLLVQADLLKADVNGLVRQTGLLKGRAANRSQKFEIQSQQVAELARAIPTMRNKLFEGATLDRALKIDAKQPVDEKDARDSLLIGLGFYADAIGRLEASSRQLDLQLTSMQHEEAISLAEANVAKWNALIGGAVAQLVDYGSSGVKAEQVGALINSLSLLWIGSGVNK